MAEIYNMQKTNDLYSISTVADELERRIATEVICKVIKASDNAIMLCMEQYYFRVKNYAALTVLLSQENEYQDAVVVGAGGGSGLSNISWGANKSIAIKAKKALEELGFMEK